jgi:tetratricopeptide (TPR) repeat protein
MVPMRCQKNPHFTGRKNLLKLLRQKLFDQKQEQYTHRVALYGLGGVGKTQLAIEYVVSHEHYYNGIYWITAVNQAALLSGYREIATKTGCVSTDMKLTDLAMAVLAWLWKQDRWLLVLDNLDDISVACNFLPRLRVGGGHLLITTRDPNAIGIPAEGLEVAVLDVDDAKDLLLLRSNLRIDNIPFGQDVENEAIQVVKTLGFLALAIEQAAAYIREQLKDIFKFMTVYSRHRKALHSRRSSGNWEYQWEVATTWLLSFEEIEKRNPDAAKLLRLFAFLNPDRILLDFLEAGKTGLPDILNALVGDLFSFNNALGDLERFSLIRRPANASVVSIHRLVQSVIKDEMAADDTKKYSGMVLGLCDSAFPEFTQETRQLCQRYQGQVVGPLFEIVATQKGKRAADVIARVAGFLFQDGKYGDCEQLFKEANAIYTVISGDEGVDTLDAMSNLALAYLALGRAKDAAGLQKKVLEANQRILGQEHRRTLTAMHNLALSYSHLGQAKDAAELQEKVLEAMQRILGQEHPDTLTAMNNLASSYAHLRRIKDAVELQEKVLKTRQRILGLEHPDTLMTMSNLAWSYRKGQTKEAAELQEKVLEARQRILGPEHPDTLTAMTNLALSYRRLGRTKNAAELQEKTVDAMTRVLGDMHSQTLVAIKNLVVIYKQLGRTEEVTKLQKLLDSRRPAS